MIDQFTFGQMHLIWPVVFGAVTLWLLFIWKEWTGELGSRFYVKLLVGLIAVTSLAMIALQPYKNSTGKQSYVAILSKDYQKTQLDSLKAVHKNIKSINYKPGENLSHVIRKGQEVFVLGQGLKAFDLWQLDEVKAHILPGVAPAGLSKLNYTRENTVGNVFIVQGEYYKSQKGHQLVLIGPGETSLDSVQLEGALHQKFSLETQHLIAGKFVYNIIEKDSMGQAVSSSSLPVKISEKSKLNILIINQFPSFETKYLKNFLAESGHGVMVRSQVSVDRYKYEFFNTQKKQTLDLTRKVLDEFDLLIIDAPSLKKVSRGGMQELRNVIAKQGLGVIIQADYNTFTGTNSLTDFSFEQQSDETVSFENDPKTSLTKYPYVFKKEVLLETVHDAEPGIITAYRRSGAGRIGTTVLLNTYELILEGKSAEYQNEWSKFISMVSKRKDLNSLWEQEEMMVYLDEPFHFKINTRAESPLVKSQEGFSIPLARDMDLKQLWRGTTYPNQLGWNQLTMNGDSTSVFDFYVMDTTQLKSLAASKIIRANSMYFNDKGSRAELTTTSRPVSPWWFFILFLLAMSFLWFEPKV